MSEWQLWCSCLTLAVERGSIWPASLKHRQQHFQKEIHPSYKYMEEATLLVLLSLSLQAAQLFSPVKTAAFETASC